MTSDNQPAKGTKKQKRASIRTKILIPYVFTIIGIPAVIFAAFQIFMNFSISQIATTELDNIYQTTTALIDNRVVEGTSGTEGANESAANLIRELKAVLTAAKMTANTKFYLFDEDMKLLFPQTPHRSAFSNTEQGVDEGLLLLLSDNRQLIQEEQITKLKSSGDVYFVTGKQLTYLNDKLVLNIVMVNQQKELYQLLSNMDVVLGVVALVASIIGCILAFLRAHDISRATRRLCNNAQEIGSGNFIQSEPDRKEIKEIADLSISLNEMSNRLKQYDETQKSFLQNVSHELRTPLMSIQGYAEGIEYHVFDDVEHAASIISDESKRMTSLVEELLTLSRLETETIHVNMQHMELNELLGTFIERMNGLTLLKDVQIQLIPLSVPTHVYVDEVLLSQAITNIVGNGVRHAVHQVVLEVLRLPRTDEELPSGCFLSEHVSFSRSEMVMIRIWDDGEGFATEDLPYLFERFYKGKGGKFGIGLAIAKSSVEKMGGQIRAYNLEENGCGACFELTLPISFP